MSFFLIQPQDNKRRSKAVKFARMTENKKVFSIFDTPLKLINPKV
jgi:hypothetical protein